MDEILLPAHAAEGKTVVRIFPHGRTPGYSTNQLAPVRVTLPLVSFMRGLEFYAEPGAVVIVKPVGRRLGSKRTR